MTRYARAGKGTHQRVPKDPTPWNDMKPPEPERVRGAKDGGRRPPRNKRKERFSKTKRPSPEGGNERQQSDTPSKMSSTEKLGMAKKMDRSFKKSKNENIRGFGQSKTMKIFGQFWVPLEDGKRLKNLLRKLKSQGLPRKEILEALKNERRKAEKSAKRQRDKTCFQCRQFGHVLGDCPNLKKAIVGDSLGAGHEDMEGVSDQGLVCFKCGSTEHTSRNCRRKGDNFEFAKCFICSGSGHIARQCPQNTNGIYPSGGSCSECGSTAHLKKDCPVMFEANQGPLGKMDEGDNDAVTLRMADPFASTEYEPVFDFGGDDSENGPQQSQKNDEKIYTTFNDFEDKPVTQKAGKRAGKRKSKTAEVNRNPSSKQNKASPSAVDVKSGNENMSQRLISIAHSIPSVNKPLFANTNKKRKIVKF